MKFLPENRKKTWWSIGLLVFSVSGIILTFSFNKRPISLGEELSPVPGPSATEGVGKFPSGSLLPFGSKLNLRILSSENFRALKGVPKVRVSPEELGKEDLFFKE